MSATASSPFLTIPMAPPDPIFGLTESFVADSHPDKVNLGVGVYQDGNGKVPVLRSVRAAEKRWFEKEDSKSYLPIDGVPAYNKQVQNLLFGSASPFLVEGRAVTVETLGGTGGLKIGADFLKRFFPGSKIVISNPSWENHRALFESAGFVVENYAYYDKVNHGLDFDAMLTDLTAQPDGTIVVLHACCHNPSGVDLSPVQWDKIVSLFQTRNLVAFLDFAYQGFGNGIDEDAYAVRAFANAGIQCLISNSFSKSFSLYRERVGALTVLTTGPEESKRVLSQLKRVIRTNYSNPPSHGGQVVALILGDPELRAEWEIELAEMRERILTVRTTFVDKLAAHGVDKDFGFIKTQKGMFSFAGLSLEAVHKLRSDYSLYIVDSSRICVAALNDKNIDRVCEAIASVLKVV